MTDSARNYAKAMRFQLQANPSARDDIYHAIVRYAAQNKQDRYALWQLVVAEAL